MFDRLVGMLEVKLPDLGTHLAVDSKAIPSHGNPVRDETRMARKDRRRDTDADFGSKTYKGVRRDGSGDRRRQGRRHPGVQQPALRRPRHPARHRHP
jgi:hypothetical protein